MTFTTGAPLPTDTRAGRVIDWTTQRAVPQSLIEAALLPDSLVYRGTTDSTGRFRLGPLPPGQYLVYGILDQNTNRRRDGREQFDSIRVASRDSIGELWAFRHDTVAARIQTVTKTDSVTALVTFNQSLDPYFTLSADSARLVQLPDSTCTLKPTFDCRPGGFSFRNRSVVQRLANWPVRHVYRLGVQTLDEL